MYLKFHSSVATPQYVAGSNSVVECSRELGKKLLAERDASGRPVCEVASSPADIRRAKPLHMCETAEAENWGLSEDSE